MYDTVFVYKGHSPTNVAIVHWVVDVVFQSRKYHNLTQAWFVSELLHGSLEHLRLCDRAWINC